MFSIPIIVVLGPGEEKYSKKGDCKGEQGPHLEAELFLSVVRSHGRILKQWLDKIKLHLNMFHFSKTVSLLVGIKWRCVFWVVNKHIR